MSVHLPYYALEDSAMHIDKRQRDRSDALKRPLRRHFSLTMPHNKHPTLVEAISSFAVMGRESRWTSICLVDSFWQLAEDGGEDTIDYHTRLTEVGPEYDPAMGTLRSQDCSQDPVLYFLVVFEHRLRKIYKEYQNIVQQLKDDELEIQVRLTELMADRHV
jgi:hypothetical protein